MTNIAEQSEGLTEFGYSPKERQFLTLAALHSGYFMRRQYVKTGGEASQRLHRKLMNMGHAETQVRGYQQHVYHLNSRPFYNAIGAGTNGHRLRRSIANIKEKLLGFDYVLANLDRTYLPTEDDKVQYFTKHTNLSLEQFPGQVAADGALRFFLEKFPIWYDDMGHTGFCYVDSGVFERRSFRSWLARYKPLLHSLPTAQIIFVTNSKRSVDSAWMDFLTAFPHQKIGFSKDLHAVRQAQTVTFTEVILNFSYRWLGSLGTDEERESYRPDGLSEARVGE